jgi:putative ABC transport system permease protein
MNKKQFFLKMVIASLLKRRGRMITALLAVSIGGAVLCGLLTLYFDIPRQMGREFRSYGANLIVYPKGEKYLSEETISAALSHIPPDALVGAAPYRYRLTRINERPFLAAGTDLEGARKTSPWWFIVGRWPARGGEAIIGKEIAQTLQLVAGSVFSPAGSDALFTVSGILETGGVEESFFIVSLEDFISIPDPGLSGNVITVGAAVNNSGGNGLPNSGTVLSGADVLELSVARNQAELSLIADAINQSTGNAEARLVKRLTASEGGVLGKLGSLTAIVTVIVLFLTMICVATTMISAVAERRREIGLKKALGASNTALFSEFLGEAIFLGLFGGILGALLGVFFAQIASANVFHRPIAWKSSLAPLTVIVSVIITVLSSLLPLKQAVSVDPAIVLRGE